MSKQAVIFDLDGTLLNTLDDLKDALNHALSAHGFPARSLDEVRRFVGNGNLVLVRRGLGAGADEAAVERVYETFLPYYQAHAMDKTAPYPGIPALLDALKAAGVKMAIATNKVHAAALPLCRKFFPQVDVVIGAQEDLRNKPEPDMVRAGLEALGVTEDEAVYIGDTEVDIATARNAGLDCVCVAWGFRSKDEQQAAGGRTFAQSPEEILALL